LVSIIVPVLNRRDVIMETLESVRTQTYTPIELLGIVDTF
jgi:glycosyltransferase involved in cell wall biosynthesis